MVVSSFLSITYSVRVNSKSLLRLVVLSSEEVDAGFFGITRLLKREKDNKNKGLEEC